MTADRTCDTCDVIVSSARDRGGIYLFQPNSSKSTKNTFRKYPEQVTFMLYNCVAKMLSRSFVSAVSLLQRSKSRIFAAPVRNLSALNSRSSLLRPSSVVVSRPMSNQETASGNQWVMLPVHASLSQCSVSILKYFSQRKRFFQAQPKPKISDLY